MNVSDADLRAIAVSRVGFPLRYTDWVEITLYRKIEGRPRCPVDFFPPYVFAPPGEFFVRYDA